MLFAQYMVLKKGSLLLCLFTFHQKRAPSPLYFTNATEKFYLLKTI